MIKLVESIRILNGRVSLLKYHEDRCNLSRKNLFAETKQLKFSGKIIIPANYQKGLVKCRLIYGKDIEDISFQHYIIRKINKIKIIYNDSISYQYKYLDRKELDDLFKLKMECDEVMIVKNGLITDAYYYNFVFQKGKEYFTPKVPLLEGVRMTNLILNKRIIKKDIFATEIHKFDTIHLINAMTSLGKIVIKPNQIIY